MKKIFNFIKTVLFYTIAGAVMGVLGVVIKTLLSRCF